MTTATTTNTAASAEVRTMQQLINGEWVAAASGQTFDDINPYTGEVFARIPASGAADAKRAIEAAEKAFPAWAYSRPSPAP